MDNAGWTKDEILSKLDVLRQAARKLPAFPADRIDHIEPGVMVAPNPVSALLSITAASPIARLRIVSADGRVVHSAGMIADRAVVDVEALKSGAYTVLAELHDGSIGRARFIKLNP